MSPQRRRKPYDHLQCSENLTERRVRGHEALMQAIKENELNMQQPYFFLPAEQIRGRVLSNLGIPNLCGEIQWEKLSPDFRHTTSNNLQLGTIRSLGYTRRFFRTRPQERKHAVSQPLVNLKLMKQLIALKFEESLLNNRTAMRSKSTGSTTGMGENFSFCPKVVAKKKKRVSIGITHSNEKQMKNLPIHRKKREVGLHKETEISMPSGRALYFHGKDDETVATVTAEMLTPAHTRGNPQHMPQPDSDPHKVGPVGTPPKCPVATPASAVPASLSSGPSDPSLHQREVARKLEASQGNAKKTLEIKTKLKLNERLVQGSSPAQVRGSKRKLTSPPPFKTVGTKRSSSPLLCSSKRRRSPHNGGMHLRENQFHPTGRLQETFRGETSHKNANKRETLDSCNNQLIGRRIKVESPIDWPTAASKLSVTSGEGHPVSVVRGDISVENQVNQIDPLPCHPVFGHNRNEPRNKLPSVQRVEDSAPIKPLSLAQRINADSLGETVDIDDVNGQRIHDVTRSRRFSVGRQDLALLENSRTTLNTAKNFKLGDSPKSQLLLDSPPFPSHRQVRHSSDRDDVLSPLSLSSAAIDSSLLDDIIDEGISRSSQEEDSEAGDNCNEGSGDVQGGQSSLIDLSSIASSQDEITSSLDNVLAEPLPPPPSSSLDAGESPVLCHHRSLRGSSCLLPQLNLSTFRPNEPSADLCAPIKPASGGSLNLNGNVFSRRRLFSVAVCNEEVSSPSPLRCKQSKGISSPEPWSSCSSDAWSSPTLEQFPVSRGVALALARRPSASGRMVPNPTSPGSTNDNLDLPSGGLWDLQ